MKSKISDNFSRLVRFVRKHRAGLVISTTVCFISLGIYVALYISPHPIDALRILEDFELKTLDTRFKLRGARKPGKEVVIVAIDQKSQDVLGRWPFPRSNLAQAVDVLREAGARVIAFDINFPQREENSAGARAEADNDKKFAAALSRFDNVVLGYFILPPDEAKAQKQVLVNEFINYLSFQAYPKIVNKQYADRLETQGALEILEALAISPNLPEFALYAKNFGYFNVRADPDGTIRREPVIIRFKDSFYPSLDVAAALAYSNLPLDQVSVVFNPNGLERIVFGKTSIPTDPRGFVQIDYYGRAGTFPTYSLADVVHHKLPAEALEKLRDSLVLIGATATGIGDRAVTPFQEEGFFGVEAHANFISNILHGHFIHRGWRENIIDILFLLFFSLVAGIIFSTVPPLRATRIMLGFLVAFWGLAYYLFAYHRVWILAFLPAATLTFNYAAIVSTRLVFEEREKKRVRDAFRRHVAPGRVNQLLEHPELLRLGGEEQELTAMFTDIRNFTSISEGLPPHDLVELLNEHFSEMTELIFQYWGTLDKYIGDSMMAFWGAPYPQSDHAARACRAALAMLQRLRVAQERQRAQGRPSLDIGIGVHTGPMVVGNMGSDLHLNYSIMGDNVNLASRLENLNKTYRTHLIVSESTYQIVQQEMLGRELDSIRVKGRLRPVKIYELLGPAAGNSGQREFVDRFHAALEAYRAGRWETAIGLFGELLRDYPDDGPTQLFTQRCMDLIESPPEGDWDGVFVMKTK
jgi:adenylate cyclase